MKKLMDSPTSDIGDFIDVPPFYISIGTEDMALTINQANELGEGINQRLPLSLCTADQSQTLPKRLLLLWSG
jgi:hypothetical protein